MRPSAGWVALAQADMMTTPTLNTLAACGLCYLQVPPIDITSDEGVIPNHIEGKVVFKDVTFTYPTRPDTVVMDNFSVEANMGKTLALVGPSGSGKSTTVQLIR